ncbi:prepilin peptidase [Streptomyces sp. RG38]|uniref:Prepilin peptidase n=1 Tax=Streptomyces tagetis TaxID=2820809 RepID=A0A941AZI4_9ACTN|nr:prepilin peptidase [Streptomyces sp. RG38]
MLPRAAYRFSVPSDEPWLRHCPAGHAVRGWMGPAPCAPCARRPAPDGTPGAGAVAAVTGTGSVSRPDPGADPGAGPLPLAVLTAGVCVVLAGATGARPELGVWLVLAPVGVLLAVVDLRVRRLPDPLTLPLAAAALALLGLAALVPGHAGRWSTALLGALALGAGHYALYRLNPAGMGFGDVKLALGAGAVLGWYGWPAVMLGTLAGFLLGAVYGGALVLAGRANRKTAIAFGPFLITGTYLGLLSAAWST